MILLKEWNAMSRKEQTLNLENNAALSGRSESQRGLVQGVGINDATYRTMPTVEGGKVMCPAYSVWAAMLKRAYSNKYHEKNTTYKCVNVCDEWRSFMSFRGWWIENQVDGWQIYKDLLSDAKVYSPSACLFVPPWLNSFTMNSGVRRGNYPVGAAKHKATGKYQSTCKNTLPGKLEHLGLFKTPEEAHLAWLTRKLELALELKPKMDEIDPRIYPRVVEIINNAK